MEVAEIFKFFNSAPGDERWHYASDFADYFGDVLSSGLLHKDGTPNLQVKVNVGTMQTYVEAGKALIQGYQYQNTTPLFLAHGLPEANLDRIDRIVLRLDKRNNARFIRLFVKEGVSATNPVPPSLQRDQYVFELSLAQIRLTKNTSSLEPLKLVDERMKEDLCGIVYSLISVPTSVFQQQWDYWFNLKKQTLEDDMEAWQIQQKNDFETWQAIQKQEYLTWIESIKDILDENVAANLAARIAELEQTVNPHITDLVKHNNYGTATGTNTLVVTLTPAPTILTEGLTLRFKITTANTGATTLNVNGLGAKPLRKNGGIALSAGNLKAGGIYSVTYDGTSFLLADEGGEYGNAVEGDVRKGKTIGTAGGLKTGTLDLTNVKPENIRQGIIIDGVTGNLGIIGAGENQILPWEWSTTPRVTSESKPYWLLSDYGAKIEKSGKYRVKWRMSKLGSPSGGVPLTVYARLYLNDQPIPGTDRQITSDTTTNDQNYTLDIDLKTGDILRCGGMTPSDSRPTLYVYIDGIFTDLKTTPVKLI